MSLRFDFIETPLSGLYKIERKPIADNRGSFTRFYCSEEFKEIGFTGSIVQMNQTLTKQTGTVRGMHYQYSPFAETKIVTCIRGEILDVVVDIRSGSSTFLQWHAEILSEESQSSLYIPEGFAHGFQSLDTNCELFYMHSSIYQPDAEGRLNILDPTLSIDWPLVITEISDRDRNQPYINESFVGLDFQ